MSEKVSDIINSDNKTENNKIDTENKTKKNKYACQEKWQKKAGYISKTYKLKKEIAEEFARACKKAGVSQAAQMSEMMSEFIGRMSVFIG